MRTSFDRPVVLAAVLGDDLTGTADAAAGIARGRPALVARRPDCLDAARYAFLACSTHSRDAALNDALARVRRAMTALVAHRPEHVMKKVDSTLRGHLGPELALVREMVAPELVVIAPAFPAQGRRVLDGALARDDRPGARPEPVAERFSFEPDRVRLVGLETVRARALAARPGETLVCDAQLDADLDCLVAEVLGTTARTLWVGSAGLAHALGRALSSSDGREPGTVEAAALPRRDAAVLCVIGTMATAARAQLAQWKRAGLCVVEVRSADVLGPAEQRADTIARARRELRAGRDVVLALSGPVLPRAADRLERALAGIAATLLDLVNGVVLTGGATAEAVLEATGIASFVVDDEVEPGVPLGYAPGRDLSIVTKAGAFGGEDILLSCRDALRARSSEERTPR